MNLDKHTFLNEFDVKISLNMSEIKDIKNNILKKIKIYENKNYKDNYGYLKKIIKIINYKLNNVINTNFNTDILCNVKVQGLFINPQINSVVNCVIKENDRVLIAKNDILKILIIENIKNLKIETHVKILVLAKQIKYNHDYINILGRLID
jgi:hypothetical protein